MSRAPIEAIKVPVGDHPGWEQESNLEGEDLEPIQSISDSSVVLQSLKQSRDKWLSRTFRKFSSKSRGSKQPDVVPPPHFLQPRGRCDVQIGPHVFSDTSFYEAHYLSHPQSAVPQHGYVYYAPPVSAGASRLTTFSPATSQGQQAYAASAVNVSPSNVSPFQSNASPALSNISSTVSITPQLVAQVNSAASTNPTLANLLQLAASGRASAEQLKTLGVLIQQLSTSTNSEDINGVTMMPVGGYNIRDFDLIIEFRETASERWIFPRSPAVCEHHPNTGRIAGFSDISLSTWIPFENSHLENNSESNEGVTAENAVKECVTIQLCRAPDSIWDTLCRWAGGPEKMEANRKLLENIKRPSRAYLAHQLREGPLLTQVQAAAIPSFATKALKTSAGDSSRAKRRVSRKASARPTMDAVDSQSPSSVPPAKRKKSSQPKTRPALPQIACFCCGQTDVPLIMGGRFCRPCVETGKADINALPGGALNYTYRLAVPPSSSQVAADGSISSNPYMANNRIVPPTPSSVSNTLSSVPVQFSNNQDNSEPSTTSSFIVPE